MAAGIFRRRQRAPNQPLRINASHPLAAGLGLFGWAIGANRVWNALTGRVVDLSAAGNATGTFTRGAGDNGPTLRMAGGERGGGTIYNPTSATLGQGTLVARFKPAQSTSGTVRPYVLVGNSTIGRGLLIGMASATSSHGYGVSSSNGWLIVAGNGVDEQAWRTVGVNDDPAASQFVQGWIDGAYQGSTAHTGVDVGTDVPTRFWFGRDPTNYYGYPTGDVGWFGYWHRRLSAAEHRLLHEEAWSLVAPASLVQGWRFAVAAGGSDATAPGATVVASALLVPGAATAASAVVGATLVASAALVAGAAAAASAANGATLAAAASLVAGAGAAASTAPGATATATVGLLAGTATAASAAPGSTVGAIASLLAGSATGTGDGAATGATLATVASVIAGQATAASTASGAAVSGTVSIIPGAAAGHYTAAAATLTIGAALVPGAATAASQAAGATVSAAVSLIPGDAYDSSAATAAGAIIDATAILLPGRAQVGGVNRHDPTPAAARVPPTPAIARGALTGAVPRISATPVIPR